MKLILLTFVLLILLPLNAQQESPAPPSAGKRAYMGMVIDELQHAPQSGVLVRSVAPDSPAHKAGIQSGDIVLRIGNSSLNSRKELRDMVESSVPGDVYAVELMRGAQSHVMQVRLEPRPFPPMHRPGLPVTMGSDRCALPLAVPESIRREIRAIHQRLRQQLACLPEGFDRKLVSKELQAIRNLARDANAGRSGWMSGRAGEISIRFKDNEGSMLLHGANNIVTLEVYSHDGQLIESYVLNNEDERLALPESLLLRLRRLP